MFVFSADSIVAAAVGAVIVSDVFFYGERDYVGFVDEGFCEEVGDWPC